MEYLLPSFLTHEHCVQRIRMLAAQGIAGKRIFYQNSLRKFMRQKINFLLETSSQILKKICVATFLQQLYKNVY